MEYGSCRRQGKKEERTVGSRAEYRAHTSGLYPSKDQPFTDAPITRDVDKLCIRQGESLGGIGAETAGVSTIRGGGGAKEVTTFVCS